MDGKITALAIISEEQTRKIKWFCDQMQDWTITFLPFKDPKEGQAEMLRRQVDVIFLGLRQKEDTDFQLLDDIQRTDSTCPVICLVHENEEQTGLAAIRTGAADYLVVEHLSQAGFERALLNVMEKNDMVQQIARQRKDLRHLSAVDELTGLYNRRFCIERLVAIVLSAARYKHPLSLCMCDLDYFKSINDHYGHQAGDEVLAQFGKLVREELRSVDFAGRYGGDEFFIVFPHTAAVKSAICAERIRRGMSQIKLSGERAEGFVASATFGISDLLPAHKNEMDLLESADQALYEAKQLGRNQIALRVRE